MPPKGEAVPVTAAAAAGICTGNHDHRVQYEVNFSKQMKVKNRHHDDSRCANRRTITILLLLTKTYLPKLSINVRVLKLKTPGPHEPWLLLD